MTILALALLMMAQQVPVGEQPVDPYTPSNANAGATPVRGKGLWHAFHEQPGVDRVVDGFVDRLVADHRIAEIFKGQDIVRLRRTLKEQFCYILNGGCDYSGRTMTAAHHAMGIQTKDFDALVEDLQAAMRAEHIGFRAQNRLLAKLAPMKRTTVNQ
ncbi:group I truncated hemoglobin [Sphingomonas sp. GlSt437]|uniref:group I truncated hemoglobin n=1 Tax=Sphingomonas sp. GlSt437 TaxID=3389970 RepID=UPI003A8B029B